MGVHKVNSDKGGGVRPDITWSNIGEPDNFLPSQYFDTRRRYSELEPEKRMILALLEQAVDDYIRTKSHIDKCVVCLAYFEGIRFKPCRYGALYWDAHDFIFANLREPLPIMSFAWACQMLNIEPSAMRSGLKNWKSQRRSPVGRRGTVMA